LRHALICERAYAFYAARGHQGGHALDDWLRAEIEVDRILDEGTGRNPRG
jgi:hypothetical protein